MKTSSVVSTLTFFILYTYNVAAGLKLSIYYEALCPDSVRFIAKQLYPNFEYISKHVELDLIPYGKAVHNKKGDTWQFLCQHGPNECTGNKYQSCLLSLNNGAETDVALIHCIMRANDPSRLTYVERCASMYNVNITRLRSCVLTDEADKLLALNGDKTWNLEPNLSFVPTIVYDDKFDQHSQDESLNDLVAVICSKIHVNKPSICANKRPV